MLLWSGNKWIMTEVLKIRNILYLGFALLLVGCSGDDVTAENDFDPVGKPVMFSVGLEAQATTRTTSNMASGGRFVCTMYYHSAIGDTDGSNYDIKAISEGGTMNTAWLQVGDEGNAVYKNSAFTADAISFYWQNQLKHAFLAIADYNQLTTNDGTTTVQGKLKMYPNHDEEFDESTPYRYANSYDLTKGERTSITQQPDPIRAWNLVKPEGDNRSVLLNFEHQFSQIQVNVKNADNGSVDLTGKIQKVELLGVTTEGYVFSRINANGNVDASTYKTVDNSTSFEMFSTTTADGYQGSYNAIAFGHLYAIRVSWYEGTAEAPIVTHTPTLLVDRILESGKRYIFNLSLSRGSLNVINTNIVDWALTEYNLDAGIIN
jgi:hypothetical protein